MWPAGQHISRDRSRAERFSYEEGVGLPERKARNPKGLPRGRAGAMRGEISRGDECEVGMYSKTYAEGFDPFELCIRTLY